MLNLQERVQRVSREREREVIIGLDLAAAAGVDKACAIFDVSDWSVRYYSVHVTGLGM